LNTGIKKNDETYNKKKRFSKQIFPSYPFGWAKISPTMHIIKPAKENTWSKYTSLMDINTDSNTRP